MCIIKSASVGNCRCWPFLCKVKEQLSIAVLQEKVFYYGDSKTLYNVLGGFYGYYNSMGCPKSVAKHHKKWNIFLYKTYKKSK